jgi:hypothetical protein
MITVHPMPLSAHGPDRSLAEYLTELQARYVRLPLHDPARERLAMRICAVEAELDARSGT